MRVFYYLTLFYVGLFISTMGWGMPTHEAAQTTCHAPTSMGLVICYDPAANHSSYYYANEVPRVSAPPLH